MKVKIWYKEFYLPTKRHRKERVRVLSKDVNIELKNPAEEEFPVAFIVSDYDIRFNGGNESECGLWETEYRLYNGELYCPKRSSDFICRADGWAEEKHIAHIIGNIKPFYYNLKDEFTEKSIIIRNTFEEELEFAKRRSENYVWFDGKIWSITGEPMYVINTFGLGFNHGGTSIFVDNFYNDNIAARNYFNANDREKAIRYGVETALGRGDDQSVDSIRNTEKNIKVLIPEEVRRIPLKDHGDGNEFMNDLEELTRNSDSVFESGLLTIARTMMEISD